MKTSRISEVPPERVAAMMKSPEVVALLDRCGRLMSGTASAEERAALQERTKKLRDMPPGMMTEDMS